MLVTMRFLLAAAVLACAGPGWSQSGAIRTVDPSAPIEEQAPTAVEPQVEADAEEPATLPPATVPAAEIAATPPSPGAGVTYQDDDVFAAAEGVFGKGAEGLAKILEKVLKDQGRPNAYIAGREAGGAFAIGVRYGSGELSHAVEGKRPIYWTGPSVGFDIGGNAAKTFVLIYNLYDGEELFHRFPAAEGNLYAIGGFTASYLRRKDVVLIPIRLGVGWRAGVNVGYMRFSKESRWLPF